MTTIQPIRHIGFIQLQVTQGAIGTNLDRLQRILAQLDPPRLSLIVLPELWATGFAYRELAKLQDEVATLPNRLQELAEKYDIFLAGSLPERIIDKENLFYNTLQLIGRNGTFGTYRKRYIFPGEEEAFCPGFGACPPIATPVGTFGSMICYDLRFPKLARSQCQQGADLLLCAAQWPLARIQHWQALVIARAIENQTFMVACNGVGKNGDLTLGGHSLVVSPAGEILYEAGEDEAAKIVEINWQLKEDAQSGFKSFTAEPYLVSAAKIVTAESCVTDARQRAGIGQRVVYVVLDRNVAFSRAIEILETARQRGDYLVLGVPSSLTDLLKSYAALDCVDRVFDLGEISSSAEQRLREICLSVTS